MAEIKPVHEATEKPAPHEQTLNQSPTFDVINLMQQKPSISDAAGDKNTAQLHPLSIDGHDDPAPQAGKPQDAKTQDVPQVGPKKTGDQLMDTGGGTYIDENTGQFIPNTIDEGGGNLYDTSTGQVIHKDN